MKFSKLAKYWERLEGISSRNEMTEVLAEVLENASAKEVDKVCYLSLGMLGPLYNNPQFNLGEKLMVKAVAQAFGIEEKQAKQGYKKIGDLGKLVEKLGIESPGEPFSDKSSTKLSISEVFQRLLGIAREEGEGSVERKLTGIAELLRELPPRAAGYVARIPVGKMRLGFSDKTLLDALSVMKKGDKSAKKKLEAVYKVRPDIGQLAKVIKTDGLSNLEGMKGPEVGVPILMAQAKRMSSAEEILDKVGKCAVELKIDGFRLQIHKNASTQKHENAKTSNGRVNRKTILFSRNLDDVTGMYPDIVQAVEEDVKAEEVIIEGEAVGYNPQTGNYLPFQETMQRRRKYDIEKMAEEVPLKLIVFDCLYLDGENLLGKPYELRRKNLERIIRRAGV